MVHTMSSNVSNYNSHNKKINAQQVEQIVNAIITGKYSWACVLILRFAGSNPLDYIPYRTYIRLIRNDYLLSSFQQKKPGIKKVEMLEKESNWMN